MFVQEKKKELSYNVCLSVITKGELRTGVET